MGAWLGDLEDGWAIGNGLKCHAAEELPDNSEPPYVTFGVGKYSAVPYGPNLGDGCEHTVVMRVDMTKHECSFEVSAQAW